MYSSVGGRLQTSRTFYSHFFAVELQIRLYGAFKRWSEVKTVTLGRGVAHEFCVFRANENSRFSPFRSNITQRI